MLVLKKIIQANTKKKSKKCLDRNPRYIICWRIGIYLE